jgi:hypothetical protein
MVDTTGLGAEYAAWAGRGRANKRSGLIRGLAGGRDGTGRDLRGPVAGRRPHLNLRPLPGVSGFAFEPSAAVDARGTIGATWHDLRNDRAGDATRTAGVWVAHSGAAARLAAGSRRGPAGLRTAPLPAHNYVGEYQGLAALPGRGFRGDLSPWPRRRPGTGRPASSSPRIGPG